MRRRNTKKRYFISRKGKSISGSLLHNLIDGLCPNEKNTVAIYYSAPPKFARLRQKGHIPCDPALLISPTRLFRGYNHERRHYGYHEARPRLSFTFLFRLRKRTIGTKFGSVKFARLFRGVHTAVYGKPISLRAMRVHANKCTHCRSPKCFTHNVCFPNQFCSLDCVALLKGSLAI